MVHQFKNNGYDIVLDVNSGAIHVVDDVTYDVIGLFEEHSKDEIVNLLKGQYPEEEIKEAMEEVEELKANEELFTEDVYENRIVDFKKRQTVVKALCLHIAHDCNLACKYCFAEEGEYHGRRALMSFETGKQALDFLIIFTEIYVRAPMKGEPYRRITPTALARNAPPQSGLRPASSTF